ncbi:Lauroyl/myristoyl acyltransferase involved in lipid A biosynthesis (Lauroyl/myristoyl acyltransferase) [Alloactinosynnema sp. L-07]|uniref:phosphatidylinositol mannoside acyltransferase n=1 Tax=Alloactinosynnema sp. L-07 TaxID=1653480 RepID=UPI00065EFC90|nr:phosphatidylinositol mannoside acyltransferase [Alloactinosynnema sp. L-07]CRK58134.1 Lauroyl/myristoyl acyltransferase involved in lipid A biosynthesis (Lauroyl/myristoyl acyltransferase) [Alloactinosynnema sp. L-07]
MNFGERLAGLGYAAGWRLVRVLPESVAKAVFGFGADLAARRQGPGAKQLRANLARVVPQAGEDELDELVRQALRSYARYWMEAFRLPSMDHDAVHRSINAEATGHENLDAALAEGNGVILALPHSGNWDAAGVWMVGLHGKFATVAERLKPESLYRRFVDYRESLGFEILAASGDERSPSEVLAERLRANGIVCLLADRDLTPSGIPVTFFGAETRMPAGPAYLAAKTGAALLPVGLWFTEDGWGLRLHPRIRVTGIDGVQAATQALADVLAGDIAAHPADWHMLQKLWVEDLSADRQKALAAREEPRQP